LFTFQWREKKAVGPHTYSSYLRTAVLSEVQTDSLSTFGINLVQLLVFGSIFVQGALVSKMTANSMNQYPHYLLLHYIFLISPGCTTLSVALVYLTKHKKIRDKITREIQGLWKLENNQPTVLPCL
jgi:hypothetical protein